MVDSVNDPAPGMTRQLDSRALLLYDGQCGFCNSSVQWLLKHDRHDRFRFAPQQSAFAERVLSRHGVDRDALIAANTAYLVMYLDSPRERVLAQSDVTVQALMMVGGVWGILGRLLRAVPRFARDAAYTLLAKNRFRLSTRSEACVVPSPAERAKFLG